MKQQINLYIVRARERIPLSATQGLAIWAGVTLLLGAVYGYYFWKNRALEAELANLKGQENRLTESISALHASRKKIQPDPMLLAQEAQLQKQLKDRDAYRALLQKLKLGSREGFSPYLHGLASQHLSGLWLTDISIDRQRGVVSLQGVSQTPEKVPQYLERLGREAAFGGSRFHRFSLSTLERGVRFDVEATLRDHGPRADEPPVEGAQARSAVPTGGAGRG